MMLYKLISPSMVKATIQLPASKSISNRALIINALGKSIYNDGLVTAEGSLNISPANTAS